MSEIALLHVTFADADEAARIARIVVEERLAACANLLGPARSIYRWAGAVEEAVEERALFKTTRTHADRLARRIADLHSYDLPVIETWPASVGQAAGEWVSDATT